MSTNCWYCQYLNRYTYILNCTLSNLSSMHDSCRICFATVVALRHPTILTVLGSLPPLCTILYRLGMTGTLSRPNCVIFTSDSILLHIYTKPIVSQAKSNLIISSYTQLIISADLSQTHSTLQLIVSQT
mgnify:CR=1 FL=1